MLEKYKVSTELLTNKCSSDLFNFETTETIPVTRELIGQERAMEALKFGLTINRKGYNIFVSGSTGTGRNSYSYLVAKSFADKKEIPNDWCYVYNFRKPESPKAISLNAGMGRIFKKEIEKALLDIKIDIPKVLTSKEYEDTKNLIYSHHQKKAQGIIEELNDLAKNYNFVFKQTDKGILSIPLVDGRAMTEVIKNLRRNNNVRRKQELSSELSQKTFDFVKRIKEVEDDLKEEIKGLKESKVLKAVEDHLDSLINKYKEFNEIEEYITSMKKDIVKNFHMFVSEEEGKYIDNILLQGDKKEDFFKRYEINLFIDNSDLEGAPVIREMNPNYYNLLGKIEYINELGGLKTDHARIKPGSLHEANGGYLIIQAKDILRSKYAWDGLKRAISTQEIKVENVTELNVISETLRPEPIPLNVKVIIVGDYLTYHLLYQYDEDFKKLFKIRADFDDEMERNEENIKKIGSFVAFQCKEEGLKPFDKSAICSIIELSSRFAEHKNKLTAKFNELVEILYEADAWASRNNNSIVSKEDVKMAIERKIYRNNTYEEKLNELIRDNVLLIDTYGWKTGEINGLAVIDLGQYSFGRPSKITVNTFLSKDDIINIEREVEQSGNIYDKGVLILSGYLGEKYAKEKHLSLTASITFEQSYDGVDGDSASSTELYALLSSLSELPINQAIAVTGSVNQKGMIQPIGGVNEKIEGYYKVCKIKGFKGGEGVIIPYQNIDNLMLNSEVIEAVEKGLFSIYAVRTIDEGIEILTGVPAGTLNDEGEYEDGTVNYLVQKKLEYYSDLSKDFE
mgnify:FL=1